VNTLRTISYDLSIPGVLIQYHAGGRLWPLYVTDQGFSVQCF